MNEYVYYSNESRKFTPYLDVESVTAILPGPNEEFGNQASIGVVARLNGR
jgi:hypothetical protein